MKPTESAAPVSRLQGFVGLTPKVGAVVIAIAVVQIATGFYRTVSEGHALFPDGRAGWSLAVLTGIIVGHLVALGRDRWWGGTGSGASLTLAVLLLYGWVPAALVSLVVVVLVGVARRHRWWQGLLHGAVDILGIGAAALVLAAFGEVQTVESPWRPLDWGIDAAPGCCWPPPPISWSPGSCCGTRRHPRAAAGCRPSPAPPCCVKVSSRSPCSPSHR